MKEVTDQINEKVKDAASVKGPPPVYYLGAIGLAELIHRFVYALGFELTSIGPLSGLAVRIVIGAVLLLSGVLVLFLSNKEFVRTKQDPEPWTPTTSIISSGIYSRTRNPIYIAAAIIMIGIGIMLGNYWVIAFLIPVLIAIHYMAILPEEKYLEEKFGNDYLTYKSAVRRWI